MEATIPSFQYDATRRKTQRCEYLRVATARQLLGQTMQVYLGHFRKLVVIASLPILGFELWFIFLSHEVAFSFVMLFMAFSLAAVAIAVSDICRGNEPSIRRTYRRVLSRRSLYVLLNSIISQFALYLPIFGPFGVYVAAASFTGPLPSAAAAITVGVLLLLWWLFTFTFVPVISAIEERPGFLKAARRSFRLGRLHRGRILLFLVPIMVIYGVVAIGAGVALVLMGKAGLNVETFSASAMLVRLMIILAVNVAYPLYMVSTVLMYYDLRVRKEGFTRMLVQELHED